MCEEEGDWGQEEKEPEGWDQLDFDEEGGEDGKDQEQVTKEERTKEVKAREVSAVGEQRFEVPEESDQ